MERIDFFNRVDKSLTPDGKIHITVPYYSHPQAFADWRIQWPPFSEHSFLFLDAEWRAARAWTAGLGYESDLKLINYEYDMVTDLTTRSDDFQSFSVEHYLGIVSRLFVTLGKKREED
jgi:hypothetical protein